MKYKEKYFLVHQICIWVSATAETGKPVWCIRHWLWKINDMNHIF